MVVVSLHSARQKGLMRRLVRLWCVVLLASCAELSEEADASVEFDGGVVLEDAGLAMDAGAVIDAGFDDAGVTDAGVADAGAVDAGAADAGRALQVDRTNPQLHSFQFRPAEAAPPDAGRANGQQLAALDTRVASRGQLVIYLHGAGAPTTCGSAAHNALLASYGFHVISPCYVSDYGVGNCGADIGGCRLEAFDGVDRSSVIAISRNESIEARAVKMLERLAAQHPQGDWGWFLEGGALRWDTIVMSGISHGASTAGLVGLKREVARVVMLSGPLDTNQAWLTEPSLTPRARFWGFTHERDGQHAGHLAAFSAMMLPGTPFDVDVAQPPYGSQRLTTDADAGNPHSSLELSGASPRWPDGGARFAPVWRELYTR